MKRLTITQFAYVPAAKDFAGTVVAVIDVDQERAIVRRGSDGWLETRVPDLERRESISATDDPLRWADLFAEHLDRGDTEVSIEHVHEDEDVPLGDDLPATVAALGVAVRTH